MKKKKLLLIFSFITVFLFSIFILPPMDDKNVSAASKVDFWSGDFKYRVKPNKTLMVIASKDKAVLRIPSKVKYKNKTYKVTIIESYSTMRRKGKKNEVKKVILPSTIKTIKNSLMGNAKFISVSKKK